MLNEKFSAKTPYQDNDTLKEAVQILRQGLQKLEEAVRGMTSEWSPVFEKRHVIPIRREIKNLTHKM
jgi:hypothetical protein